MWKTRIATFLVACLLSSLVPAHAASVSANGSFDSALVLKETLPLSVSPEKAEGEEPGPPSFEIDHIQLSPDSPPAEGTEKEEFLAEEEKVHSEELELGEEAVLPAVLQTADGREEIQITTAKDLIALLNRELQMDSGVMGDWERYGIRNADIYLNADLTISSDDINEQFAQNTKYAEYENSFWLENSSFYGNGHTITITQGQRKIYPLFGRISVSEDSFVGTISDLSLVYEGNVHGTGFANEILQRKPNETNYKIQDIMIIVQGNVLPMLRAYWTQNGTDKNTEAYAAGFAYQMDGADVKNVQISIGGDIGTLQPERYEQSDTELIYARSSGFFFTRSLRGVGSEQSIQNITIQVDGSILAGSHHFRSEALGLGYDLQEKKFQNINLTVNGDIKAVAEGDSLFNRPYSYGHDPLLASAAGHDLHHLEDINLTVRGSICAENHGNIGMDTHAMGLGDWDYLHDIPDQELPANPFTIRNVTLNVDGDIQAYSTALEYESGADDIQTVACGGLFNNMSGGLDNYDTFESNQIRIGGKVAADGQTDLSIAILWGYFMGNGNQLSAKSLTASNEAGHVIAAPFYHFVKGQSNKISLANGIAAHGVGGSAAGFAIQVAQFDGMADKNEISVHRIQADELTNVGGFAAFLRKHDNQPQIGAELRNIDFVLDEIVAENSQNGATVGGLLALNQGAITNCAVTCEKFFVSGTDLLYIGGFSGRNSAKGSIIASSASLNSLKVAGIGNIGGFIGENRGKIDDSCTNLHTIEVFGNPQTTTKNNQNIGGFEGYGYGGQITNSAAFTQDSILAQNGNYVNLGGFSGLSIEETHCNNAAQIGENVSSSNNTGVVTIGGYGGKLWSVYGKQMKVRHSTALVFGAVEGSSSYTNNSSVAGGFSGVLQGAAGDPATAVIEDSASFIGGGMNMVSPGSSGEAASVGVLYDGTLSGFTVLDTPNEGRAEATASLDQYSALITPTSKFQNNYFVEVNGTGRTAVPITYSQNGEFRQGPKMGQIHIAPRVFQTDYWGKDATSNEGAPSYTGFNYVTQKTDGITLQAIANGTEAISSDPFVTASLPDFYTRHLSLWSGSVGMPGPVYDILGVSNVLKATVTITFRISNGTWEDGTTTDKHVTVPLTNGKGTLDAADIPTGMKADSGYTGGTWDRQPDTTADAMTGNVLYTYSFHRDGGHGGNGGHGGSTRYTLTYVSNGGTEYKAERYSSGTTVKLSKTPVREGYHFTGWYADKNLTDKIDRIQMTKNKTVYAGWEKNASELHIPDMLNGDDHFAYVAGYTDGTVRPNAKITRAEVAMIFYRLLDEDVRAANETDSNSFSDVTNGMWFNTAVSTIARLGIVKGRSAEIFDPNAPITRAEFATVCARFDHSSVESDKSFFDIHGHWAETFIEHAAALGWVNGYMDGTFHPNATITRAEAMAMINRILGRLPESEKDLLSGMKTWPDNADPSAWYYLTVQEATNSHSFERKEDGVHERWIKLK